MAGRLLKSSWGTCRPRGDKMAGDVFAAFTDATPERPRNEAGADRWYEDNPALVTSYALLSIQAARD